MKEFQTNNSTAFQTTPDTGGCNELTNALNAVSRCPKENITLVRQGQSVAFISDGIALVLKGH